MINDHKIKQHEKYTAARKLFIINHQVMIDIEKYMAECLFDILKNNLDEIKSDYNEASFLYPFWKNYPPDDRGNQPVADQYPWIEVGEHAVGSKLPRLLNNKFYVSDAGLPTGADQRFILTSDELSKITDGLTDSIWLFVDIKSVGPRDDQDHTVMSHNQVSGSGEWDKPEEGVKNKILKAIGKRASHDFHVSMPPLFVNSAGKILPVVIMAIKPVYTMLPATQGDRNDGQPLIRMDLVTIPNGLLLTENPNYLELFPGLLFPGKDDKSKDPRKLRARISFPILGKIADWRVQVLDINYP